MACLAALWDLGEGDVHQVVDVLHPRQTLAYTTVLTLLDRLTKRGQVSRRKQGRRFLYAPCRDANLLRSAAIDELVRLYFGGSREGLQNWLNQEKPIAAATAVGEDAGFDPTLL